MKHIIALKIDFVQYYLKHETNDSSYLIESNMYLYLSSQSRLEDTNFINQCHLLLLPYFGFVHSNSTPDNIECSDKE